jgi:hypothetical protein
MITTYACRKFTSTPFVCIIGAQRALFYIEADFSTANTNTQETACRDYHSHHNKAHTSKTRQRVKYTESEHANHFCMGIKDEEYKPYFQPMLIVYAYFSARYCRRKTIIIFYFTRHTTARIIAQKYTHKVIIVPHMELQ